MRKLGSKIVLSFSTVLICVYTCSSIYAKKCSETLDHRSEYVEMSWKSFWSLHADWYVVLSLDFLVKWLFAALSLICRLQLLYLIFPEFCKCPRVRDDFCELHCLTEVEL